MTDRDAALGRAWRDDRSWALLTRLSELEERFGGHPGERRAADLIAEAFEAAGARAVRQEGFELPVWTRGGSSLGVDLGERERTFECVALPYSPGGSIEGALVDAGYGTPSELDERDVEGCIVVASTKSPPDAARHHHRMEKVGHAVEAGAAGFVFANHVPGQVIPTGSLDPDVAIPSVGVSHETGEWLRKYAGTFPGEGSEERVGPGVRPSEASGNSGDGLGGSAAERRAHLRVDATTEPGESQNVRASLGPDTDDAVFLVAHYDAHDVGEGALDNGCGVAVVLGAVRLLADLESDLERRVEVVAVGSEELGLYGSEALADRVDADAVHAVVNVDGAGRHRDLAALTHCSDATERAVEAVADDVDHAVRVDDRPHPYSDHWHFLRRGVPTVQFHSSDPDRGGRWERGWTHTRADTLDKADGRTIREHAMLAALVVERLAADAVERVDPGTVRQRLAEIGAEPGMRAAGVWPANWE